MPKKKIADDTESFQYAVELGVQFKNAVESVANRSPALQAAILGALQDGEMEELSALSQDIADKDAAIAAGEASPDEEYYEAYLKAVDKVAALVSRVFSDGDLGELVPEEMKSDDVVAALEAHNAPNMAQLCKPKAP